MTAARVVVLGGGMAGLTAALAAAEAGGRVTLVERAPGVGGSMALSAGGIWAPKDLATARTYVPKGDPELQRVLVEGLRPLWAWLEGCGLPLTEEQACMKDDLGRLRIMALGSLGDRRAFADAMAALAESAGVRIMLSTSLESLTRAPGGWSLRGGWAGDAAEGHEVELSADAVVFATGGFHNDTERLKRYSTQNADQLLIRANRVSDGVALRLALPHGARLSRSMSSFYGHTMPYLPDGRIEPGQFLAASQYYTDYSVLLNAHGVRFTDESVGVVDEFNAQQGSRQPAGRYWLVFDEQIRAERVVTAGLAGITDGGPKDPLEFAESLGANLVRSDTLAGLAAQLDERGVPAENVIDSLQAYNEAADPVRDIFPPRLRAHQPLRAAPFYALECVAGITYTMGGLGIDTRCRVEDRGGDPIPGLYAAGADAGGVFHDVYGGGLAWAGVSGRTAGTAAAGAHGQPS